MARGKVKADCRADTRGGSWAGLPKCLIDSPAHRDLSLHARAVLVELVARMNGYNNGSIAVSQRELVEALGCSPNRIVSAIAELVDHGMLDVTVEGQWKARLARQYRLTFVTTKNAPATNEYLRWTPTAKKSGATAPIAGAPNLATGAIAEPTVAATGAIARLYEHRRKTADLAKSTATGAVSLISEPYPGRSLNLVQSPGGPQRAPKLASVPTAGCERCGEPFAPAGRGQPKRFCSEDCRKVAEVARRRERARAAR